MPGSNAAFVERSDSGVTVRLVLDGERPKSWNALKDWRTRRRENKRIALAVRAALPSSIVNGEGFPLQSPAAVRVAVHFAGRRYDKDNIPAKFYIDALKDWLLINDSPKYVAFVLCESRSDRRSPRTEITVTTKQKEINEWTSELLAMAK